MLVKRQGRYTFPADFLTRKVFPLFFICSLINWLNLRNVLPARNTSERDAVPVDISCLYDYVQELALSCLIILNTSERDAVSVDISCLYDYVQALALSCLITLNTSERDAVSVDISFLIISIQDLALSCLIILK